MSIMSVMVTRQEIANALAQALFDGRDMRTVQSIALGLGIQWVDVLERVAQFGSVIELPVLVVEMKER